MTTILAHLRVKPGCEAAFEEIARNLHAATSAHETGARRYEYWRGSEPGLYYSLLSFDDHRTFIRHQTSAHHEAATPQLRDVLAGIRLEWVDPVVWAGELPPTEHQPAPDDADELTRLYTDRFAATVADWWLALR